MHKILLFDMDDVLLEAHGYHRALQDTVSHVGWSLGYENTQLPVDVIATFEAAGVTSEWDSSAICAALLLEKAWIVYPRRDLVTNASQTPISLLGIEPPEFQSFASRLGNPQIKSLRPSERAESLMLDGAYHLTVSQKDTIRKLLRSARQIDGSLTHRIFQELVLGSNGFHQTYDRQPIFNTESYLTKFDRPALSQKDHDLLIGWLGHPGQFGAILTNRPSLAPGGFFCTPEAEIGSRLVGLEALPIAGFGGLAWLSHSRGQSQEEFIKPSPVHALTALRLVLGDSKENALQSAATLAVDNQPDPSWRQLHDAQVTVFEDTTGGLESLLAASDCLKAADIHLETKLVGISSNQQKRIALESIGAHLFPTLSSALKFVSIIP